MLSRLNWRKFKAILQYISGWFLVVTTYLFIRYTGQHSEDWVALLLAGGQFAILTGISHGIYEILVLGDDRYHRPMVEAVIMRSLFHLCMIGTNLLVLHLIWKQTLEGEMIAPGLHHEVISLIDRPDVWVAVGFAFISSYIITFIRSVHKKFGSRVLINTLLGKVQDPVEEERVFMFLDLKSATTLAEELGNFSYSSFLRDYFRLVSNCCAENRGEIYQFAGDGVIISWPIKSCRKIPHPMNCFHDLKDCFRRTRRKFEREYGHFPQFKAAMHVGRVIATEVGNFGSEMAYHGDTLNTTARLQSLCNLLKKDCLVTETFVRKMPHLGPFQLTEHGAFQLKGKNRDLEVFSIEGT